MKNLPFPCNENLRAPSGETTSSEPPWKRMQAHEGPPIMFQVEFCDGQILSYAYSDLRETRLRDAGYLQLSIYGMEKYRLTIEGRNLTELANLIGMGKIKSFVELGPRSFQRPEEDPSIDKIIIETLTGPSH
jgi:hypothetical protein